MTVKSDDPEGAQEGTCGIPVLNVDALEDLTDDEAAEAGAAAARAREAITKGSQEQLGELVQ